MGTPEGGKLHQDQTHGFNEIGRLQALCEDRKERPSQLLSALRMFSNENDQAFPLTQVHQELAHSSIGPYFPYYSDL
jgi:hypothetical protein